MAEERILAQILSPDGMREVEEWIAKYPADERQSAVMSTLRVVQEEKGYLTPESMDAVAHYLRMPPIAVYEVATFYTMYERSPVGKYVIHVCTNISCQLKNSAAIVSQLEKKLDIKSGETTPDGKFSLRTVECLGACVNAPVLQLNKDYHENLTIDKIDTLLKNCCIGPDNG
jgi:NADH-quinone oxidoreductase subunit E